MQNLNLKKLLLATVVSLPPSMAAHEAAAHNVWCHCPKRTADATLQFFYKAGEVYQEITNIMQTWHMANTPLEWGVIAEFEYILHGKPLKPDNFKETLVGLELLKLKLNALGIQLREQRALSESAEVVPEFDAAVTEILKQQKGIPRLSLQGVRYSEVAGSPVSYKSMIGISGIVDAQIEDLGILLQVLDEVIAGLRDAIPLAEKGQFARVMLSGRNAFGEKMPQFTDMMYAYERLYVVSCMSTIAATMQIYPKGFEWVQRGR